jgi:hypothetical protein
MSTSRALLSSCILISMGCVALSEPAAGADPYSQHSPDTAADFWGKVLVLLNDHLGYVTRERFEEVFGVHFGPPVTTKDNTTYRLVQGHSGYFDARLSRYVSGYTMPGDPALDGVHSELYIGWKTDSFAGPDGHACISGELVRTSLMASGWTSPWVKWGIWEETAAAARQQPPIKSAYAPVPLPQPVAGFVRQAGEDAVKRGDLPRGRLDTTGDHPDSCITGIYIVGKP